MATSEKCVDDYNRENNMNKVANGESCHLLASEQVKETDCFFMPRPQVVQFIEVGESR